jgi:hypothetical protein
MLKNITAKCSKQLPSFYIKYQIQKHEQVNNGHRVLALALYIEVIPKYKSIPRINATRRFLKISKVYFGQMAFYGNHKSLLYQNNISFNIGQK